MHGFPLIQVNESIYKIKVVVYALLGKQLCEVIRNERLLKKTYLSLIFTTHYLKIEIIGISP